MAPLRVIFMGSPDFSVPILDALIKAGHEIVCVYAQPPRPAGRGHKERPCPVHAHALEKELTVRTPLNLKSDDDRDAFADLKADIAVVAAYGLILPKPVLDAPRLGCVNVHASLLPRWRGAAPIHRAIQAGDEKSGVTIMQMDIGLDTGDMLLIEETPITKETTAETLHDTLADMGAKMIVKALDGLTKGTITATPQPEEGVTYAHKLDKGEGKLDWSLSADQLALDIRALNPWPGVWFELDGKRIKVWEAVAIDQEGEPGTALDDKLTIACGKGSLQLLSVQKAGKGRMTAEEFLRGNKVPKGTCLK